MKKLLIFLTMLLMSLTPATEAFAQNANDKYTEGMTYYNEGNMQAAIKAFKASMILDKSSANKKRCNAMIRRCSPSKKKKAKVVEKTVELSLNRNTLEFDGKSPGANVITVTSDNDWKAVLENKKDASWCILEQSEDKKNLVVRTEPSHLTVARKAVIKIKDAKDSNLTKSVTVHQSSGKAPLIYVDPEEVDRINKEGDEVLIKIDCVTDTVYSDGKKWRLKSSPDWVSFPPDKQKELKGIKKIIASKKDKSKREPLEANELSVEIAPNNSKDERTGYIVLECQDVEIHVKLKQRIK